MRSAFTECPLSIYLFSSTFKLILIWLFIHITGRHTPTPAIRGAGIPSGLELRLLDADLKLFYVNNIDLGNHPQSGISWFMATKNLMIDFENADWFDRNFLLWSGNPHLWTRYGTEDFLVRLGGKGRHVAYINKTLILMGDWCSKDWHQNAKKLRHRERCW
jgi:hypothetical protein